MDITQWLEQLGLGRYAPVFRDRGLELDAVTGLDVAALDDLGLPPSARAALVAAITDLRSCREAGHASGPTGDPSALPSIIALPLAAFARETHPVLRLWHACDFVELLVKLLVIVGLADHRRSGRLPARLVEEFRPRIEEPTLGKWKLLAQAVAQSPPPDSWVPELPVFVNEVVVPLLDGPAGSPSHDTSLIRLRNRLAHGSGIGRSVAHRLESVWSPKIARLREQGAWLSELDLVVKTDAGFGVLRGPSPGAQPYQAHGSGTAVSLAAAFALGEEVIIVRGEAWMPVWPLTLFGPPRSRSAETQAAAPAPQVYTRRGEARLEFTPLGSEDVCLSEGGESATAAFMQLFELHRPSRKGEDQLVRGFEADILRDADRLVGRDRELAHVRGLLEPLRDGVLWLTGAAGIGKSFFMARLVQELLEAPPAGALILPYRFKAGDDRCSRDRFLRFAIERLRPHAALDSDVDTRGALEAHERPIQEIRRLLGAMRSNRVLFVLDGLDEVAETDPEFAREVPLHLTFPGVTWLCAGRPDRGLAEAFAPSRCTHVFPDGLPPMGKDDIRAMLLEKIGPLRRALLLQDEERGDEIVNPFIDLVAEHAQGLPIYVTYVIGDILERRYRHLDAGTRLPPSLDHYHQELLRRCSLGDLHQVLSPLAATIAVAREPLSAPALSDLLARDDLVLPEEAATVVSRALAALGAMLRRSTTPDGVEGFTIFHHSLRQHMETSVESRGTLTTARRRLARLARDPGDASRAGAPYLLRAGVSHLLEVGRAHEAAALLTDMAYLIGRLEVLANRAAVFGLTNDWRLLTRHGGLSREAAEWEAFWRGHEHMLLQGTAEWPAWRVLHQVAARFAKASAVTRAARRWEQGRALWPRIEMDSADVPAEAVIDPCLFVLPGHHDAVNVCRVTPDGALAFSASGKRFDDFAVRVWDLRSHECQRILIGHDRPVLSLAVSRDGSHAVSGDASGTVRLWAASRSECLQRIHAHAGAVVALALSGDRARVLSAGADGLLATWEVPSGAADGEPSDLGLPVSALAVDTQWACAIVGSTDGRVGFWDLGFRRWRVPPAFRHEGEVLAVDVSRDGRLAVSGGRDGMLCVWDVGTGSCVRQWSNAPDAVSALALSPDALQVVSGSAEGQQLEDVRDRAVKVWDVATGRLVKRLTGHCDYLRGLAVSDDGRIAVTGGGDYHVRVWDLTVDAGAPRPGGDLFWIGGLASSPDGGRLVSASDDGAVRLWDTRDRTCRTVLRGDSRHAILEAAVSRDGRIIVGASEDATVRVWDAEDGKLRHVLSGHLDPVNSVCETTCGELIISGGGRAEKPRDCTIRIWRARDGRLLRELIGHDELVSQVAVTPDGRSIVSSSWDERLGLWDLASGRLRRWIPNPGTTPRGVIITPDGRTAVTCDSAGTVRAVDLRSGEVVRSFSGHTADVRRPGISADGRLLASGGDDGTLRIFDMATGRQSAVAFFDAWVTAVTFLGPRYRLVLGFSDGTHKFVNFVDGPSPGVPIVTPVLLAARVQAVFTCPWCGGSAPVDAAVRDAIAATTAPLESAAAPCLDLPDACWDEPRLLTACGLCSQPVRSTPFLGGAKEV
jgi:WD40 repeat protein